jgi:thiamine kinase-like enzyme
MAAAWLERVAIERHCRAADHAGLGHDDPNLANFLWDGGQIRLVDFEDSGPSDRPFELAIWLSRAAVRRRLERVLGATLIGLGVDLAAATR